MSLGYTLKVLYKSGAADHFYLSDKEEAIKIGETLRNKINNPESVLPIQLPSNLIWMDTSKIISITVFPTVADTTLNALHKLQITYYEMVNEELKQKLLNDTWKDSSNDE